jgi:uncharacterized membrane protein
VAIATALMPPLCTAGYGLATLKFNFLLGSLYLFIINTVFIALATFITVRLLKFPGKHLAAENADRKAHRIIIAVAIITVLPSIYFAYDIIQQNNFSQQANKFIELEGNFSNDYLLKKTIDPKAQTITLIYGGKEITRAEISGLKNKLEKYGLPKASLDVKQGFAYLTKNNNNDNEINQVNLALAEKDKEISALQNKISNVTNRELQAVKVYDELKTLDPGILNGLINPQQLKDSAHTIILWQVFIQTRNRVSNGEETRMKNWLKTRLEPDSIKLVLTR